LCAGTLQIVAIMGHYWPWFGRQMADLRQTRR